MNRSAASAGGSRPLAALWSVCVLAIGGWLAVLWSHDLPLETSVLAMLPESEQDPALHELTRQLSGRAARTIVILVGHEQRDQALAAAAFAEVELRASPEFSAILGSFDAEKERAFFELYFPRRYAMLSPRLRAQLEQGATPETFLERVREKLHSPVSSLYSGILERDPLLLYPECVQGWAEQRIGGIASDGFMIIEQGSTSWALLALEMSSDPFDAGGQRAALDQIESLRSTLAERFEGARLLFTGIPRFAAHTREAMQRDILVIGTGSMIGTALCILAAFRSLRPFLLSFLPVAVGIAAASLVCFLVFQRVHVLTLVFGTSLTGLGVDYALHYFAAHRLAGPGWNPRRSMRDILPGITLGVLTSVLGFSGLYFTPFPVLRQFALFSSVGLVAAWATVVCWYPPLLAAPHRHAYPPWLHRQCRAFLELWTWLRGRRWWRYVLGGSCLVALAACLVVRFEDDVRKLQSAPAALIDEDHRVREFAGRTDDSRFVLVEGATEEETLERLELASEIVHAAMDSKLLESCRDLSLFLPSRARQRADHALLASRLLPRFDELAASLDGIGFDAAAIEDLRGALESQSQGLIDVERWLASPASEFLRPMWLGRTARGFGATLLLGGVRDGAAIEAHFAGREGLHYIDRVRDMSELLRRYRIDTTRLVALAYAGVLLVLVLRFGLSRGLRVMLPCLLSAGLTLGLLAVGGAELNLFHLLGLLLVLGLAVDYGVFFAENGTSEATTLFALALSVITTVMAFGLMVSSSAPPLQSLGASVSISIVLALIFSPLACPSPPPSSTASPS